MRKRLRIAVLALVALAAVAVVGRIEADHAAKVQSAGFARLLALAGPHWATTPDAYRLAPTFDCLLYHVGPDPYAIELCFQPDGRIVEAIDRRNATSPTFWSLRFAPSTSSVRVDPATMLAAFKRLDAVPASATSIPLGNTDYGPTLVVPNLGGKPQPAVGDVGSLLPW